MEGIYEKTELSGGFSTRAAALTVVLMLLAVAFAGCVSQGKGEPAVLPASAGIEKAADISSAGAKTSYEKLQEEIQTAVADGTYVQNSTYAYHNGTETVEIMLEVKNDIVEKASIAAMGAPHQYSAKLISAVNGSLPSLVIGKKITELDIPANVAGSSLTTAAFKNYVQDIIDAY